MICGASRGRGTHESLAAEDLSGGAVFLALSAMSVLCLSTGSPAQAAGPFCGGNTHCYSVGEPSTIDNNGLEGQWYDELLNMPHSEVEDGYHISNEMWFATSYNSHGYGWVEEGLANACNVYGATSSDTCADLGGEQAYLQFWATQDNVANKFYFRLIDNLSPDGDNHVYEIWDTSSCDNDDFTIYVDFAAVGTATDQHSCKSDEEFFGIELSSPGANSGEVADTFNNYMQYYDDGVGWEYYGSPAGEITIPCGTYPNGECLNGTTYQDSEWSDNKPS